MNRSERIRLFEQLATMTHAGIPLREATRKLGVTARAREVRLLARAFEGSVTAEEAFTAAKFNPFEVRLIAAGERSARLEEVFAQLGAYWRQQDAMARRFFVAMLYPVGVLHVAAVLAPLITAFSTGEFQMMTYLWGVATSLFWIYAIGVGAWVLLRLSWRSEAGQLFWMRLPVIGNVWKSTYAYRWILALRLEYSAGIAIPEAVADAWEATGFALRHTRAEEGRRLLMQGEGLAETYARWTSLLPAEWLDYLATAELSGRIEETLDHLHAIAKESWLRWQTALSEWMPRVAYTLIVLYALVQMGTAFYGILSQQAEFIKGLDL